MRRLAPILAVALATAALALPGTAAANGCPLRFAQGTTGTADDPIRIGTVADLTVLATSISCYLSPYVYRQTADLDLTGVTQTPIGNTTAGFVGTYDGAGHSISGLSVTSADAAGLFGVIDGGTVRSLTLQRPTVVGQNGVETGALAGTAVNATISDVRVVGASVTSSGLHPDTGGLIGSAYGGALSDLSVAGTVSTSGGATAGGLIGQYCGTGTISRTAVAAAVTSSDASAVAGGAFGSVTVCVGSRRLALRPRSPAEPITVADVHATGAVTAAGLAGGFLGHGSGSFSRVSATGSVTAGGNAGGFAATLLGGAVTDAYAIGSVSASGAAGGFASAESETDLTNVYAAGAVRGGTGAGGLVQGYAPVSLTQHAAVASYWDTDSTGQAESLLGTGKTTTQLQAIGTFSGAGWTIAAGWSAAAGRVWGICPTVNGGRPFLVGQYTADPCAAVPGKPGSLTLTSRDGAVRATWSAPASDGGSPITGYTVTAQMQQAGKAARPSCTATPPQTTCTITGLRNGRRYRVTVTATSLAGAGSAAIAFVTPRAPLTMLSTQRSGRTVVTRVRVNSPGVLTQYGEPARSNGVACRASRRTVEHAGVVTVRCPLNAIAIRTLEDGALRLRIVTRFRPATGAVETVPRVVTFPRTVATADVTG